VNAATLHFAQVREGLLFALLPKSERERDPLIAHCEDYSVLRSRSPTNGHELCAWTDMLFGANGPKETAEQRRLRHAACLMSDVSWRAHPDYRGEQSIDLIARASLAGVDHPGRVFVALAVCYRHIGDGKLQGPDSKLVPLLSSAEQKRAILVGAAIRAGVGAHQLSSSTISASTTSSSLGPVVDAPDADVPAAPAVSRAAAS